MQRALIGILIFGWCCAAQAQLNNTFLRDGFEVGLVLNDSGQTRCSNSSEGGLICPLEDFPNQDAENGRDALAAAGLLQKLEGADAGFDYSKISNRGTQLPSNAQFGSAPDDWACTLDNSTGLLWELKLANPGSFRHQSHLYAWLESNPAVNGGNPGGAGASWMCASTLAQCNTQAYIAAINSLVLCGHSDWRLPTMQELSGLINDGRLSPTIDPAYFPNTPGSGNGSFFWTDRNFARDPNQAWMVNFQFGTVYESGKINGQGVRLVRGGRQ